MPKLLLTHALLLFYLAAAGQATLQSHKETNSLEVEFAPVNYSKPLSFSGIEVLDCRFDTSKMGYSGKKDYYRVVTKEAFSKTIESLLNRSWQKNFSDSSNRTLLLVVRRFWFRETTPAEEKGKFRAGSAPGGAYTACSFKFEIYVRQGNQYIPIMRIDSVCNRPTVHQGKSFSLDAFEACLERLEQVNLERRIQTAAKLSREDINTYNRQALSKPVFNGPVLHAGVFITFDDFLQNRVRYSEFELELTALTDQLYVVENGGKKLLTEFWGYCTGSTYFIKLGYNFFELKKAGNTFEFWGSKSLIADNGGNTLAKPPYYNSSRSLVSGLAADGILNLLGAGKIKSQFRPFQLNMENGEVN